MCTQSKQIQEHLQGFCGSETCYSIPMFKTRYTEGVKYLAEAAQCYWLITDAAVITKSLKHKSSFLVIYFKRFSKEVQARLQKEAQITYADGSGTILFQQDYELTDLPLDELRLFFVENMLMLPNEY
ncbi:DUF6876 family protein [Leeuwenhoekiella marinoflava]|uniref:DUF6876 domain-containing protein n=2 Tax=Leeuwenhoekiella marinoflava TaxID=988 RepID=A0A4Q0P5K6_9FLAO|nr:DUF6876 family protein [Leeuwenhoekiella marinoflava]RXG21900.1 hypothetical protein DSL99_4011 [Leeuwenhoekiella marinoflava]SHG01943.1 hypothetical protein SAMN02745246_03999 [Leeuwenhoekiella marinoflava DSM 3653]